MKVHRSAPCWCQSLITVPLKTELHSSLLIFGLVLVFFNQKTRRDKRKQATELKCLDPIVYYVWFQTVTFLIKIFTVWGFNLVSNRACERLVIYVWDGLMHQNFTCLLLSLFSQEASVKMRKVLLLNVNSGVKECAGARVLHLRRSASHSTYWEGFPFPTVLKRQGDWRSFHCCKLVQQGSPVEDQQETWAQSAVLEVKWPDLKADLNPLCARRALSRRISNAQRVQEKVL